MRPNLLLVLCIAGLTFICYRYSLHNEFTNWDDNKFITDNPYIKNLSPESLKMICLHDVTGEHFIPITLLSYAMNYHFSQLNPRAYYLTNIIFHILNTLLVFYLMLTIFKAMERNSYEPIKNKSWSAAFCALCFGVHPMHVESVSWVAERKDVLYCFFYFISILAYIRFVESRKLKWLAGVWICFLLSLLSKPVAIVLPLSLLAVDYLLKRDKVIPIAKLVIEKIPMIIIALGSAYMTYSLQKSFGAIPLTLPFSAIHRLLFASLGMVMYITKAFIPAGLSSYYMYPIDAYTPQSLPFLYYLSPFILAVIFLVPLYFAKKKSDNYFRVIISGFTFFIINIILVSQIISSGPNMMADRYTYIPYFGIFFMVGYCIEPLLIKPLYSFIAGTGMVIFLAILSLLCYNRTKIWHDSRTLWESVINRYPHQAATAYKNLGSYYGEKGQNDSAYINYLYYMILHSGDASVYSNIGNIFANQKNYPEAIAVFNFAMRIDSTYNEGIFLNRGLVFTQMGRNDLAISDFDRAYRLNPWSEKILEGRANSYFLTAQYDKAIGDYDRLIQINPQEVKYYINRAVAEADKGGLNDAMNDLNFAINKEPANVYALYDISHVYKLLNDYGNALTFAYRAKNAGYPVTDYYISTLINHN